MTIVAKEKRMSHPTPGLTWGAIVLAGLSALGTVYVEYTNFERTTVQRISVLETHQADQTDKLDHIQAQVDKLVDWLLGQK